MRPSQALREHARRALAAAVGRVDGERTALGELLEAAGRLELVEPGAPRALVAGLAADRVRALLEDGLGIDAIDAPPLPTLAADVIAALDERDGDDALDPVDGERFSTIEAALAARDRVELQHLGAEALLGASFALEEELEVELEAYEALLRPELWRLTSMNAARARELEWIPRAARARFWWRFDGIDIDARAYDAMAAVASLVSRFPEARRRLDGLVDAEARWTERPGGAVVDIHSRAAGVDDETAGGDTAGGNVVSLWAWVKARKPATAPRASADEASTEPLSVAAAPDDDEIPLLARPELELSFREPSELILDVTADRDPSRMPLLVLPDGRAREMAPVPGAFERFSVQLDASDLRRGGAVLRLALAGGTIEVNLPPEGE